jgi:two-component system, cell cycle response regulator
VKILVADDDPVSRRPMGRMLQRGGYEVITVQNGRQAAHELFKAAGPRLALIDWMMPELDGRVFVVSCGASTRDSYVYILLLTSKRSGEDLVEGLQAGADDYLRKPCHAAELKARLAYWPAHPRARR